jgi:cysteine-rich repeat protein
MTNKILLYFFSFLIVLSIVHAGCGSCGSCDSDSSCESNRKCKASKQMCNDGSGYVCQCEKKICSCEENSDCISNTCQESYSETCQDKKIVEYTDYVNDELDTIIISDTCQNTCSCSCSNCIPNCLEPVKITPICSFICGAECTENIEEICTPDYEDTCQYCTNSCEFQTLIGPFCGDSIIQEEFGEECDDGNNIDGDGCSADCIEESGYECEGFTSECNAICGDKIINYDDGEECDDGDLTNGNGCNKFCKIEQGWGCIGEENSVCNPICGDGFVVEGKEECDSSLDKCCSTDTCILQKKLYQSYFVDSDNDGYGYTEIKICTLESIDFNKFREKSGDCDETNSKINPGAQEKCDEDIDYDCDGNLYNSCSCKEGDLIDCQKNGGICAGYNLICKTGEVPSCNWKNDISNYQDDEKICDNLDNDCDGIVDEGCDDDFDLYVDSELPCNYQFLDGLKNIRSCIDYAGDCDDTDKNIYLGNKELCNGIDDDCDGKIDNINLTKISDCFSLPQLSNLKPIGVCQKITAVCTDSKLDCQLNNFENIETSCDNLDNDCDGEIDEGCLCISGQTKKCGSNIGECIQGTQTCNDDETWGKCIGLISATPEICDSLDNDCDNLIDEKSDELCTQDGCSGKQKCINGELTTCDATCISTNIEITLSKEDINRFIQEADFTTNEINQAQKTMEVVDQSIDYIYDNDTTLIKNNIESKQNLQDFEYTLFIPKCLTKYLKDIDFKNDNYTIIEEDPVIAWHFVEVSDSIDLSYEVNGQISYACLEKIKGLPVANIIGVKNSKKKDNLWLVIISIIIAIGLTISLATTKKSPERKLETEQDFEQDFIKKQRIKHLEQIKKMKFKSKQQAQNYMHQIGLSKNEQEWILQRL